MSHYLRPLRPPHYTEIKEVYREAIENLGDAYYTKEQIQAWSALAVLPGVLDQSLNYGKGWISVTNNQIAAFALRYPINRVALLYCRSSFSRMGHATALLKHIELEARQEGQEYLLTEASSFSYPLLIKFGWSLLFPERIQIGGVNFTRYRMQKNIF